MISLVVALVIFVGLFALIGGMRGWAKELLVTFSVILSLFLIGVLESLTPGIRSMFADMSSQQFWFRALLLGFLVIFGYQSPKMPRLAEAVRRERFSDMLLGFFLGAINGYLIFGSLWYFMHFANYPFEYFLAPDPSTPLGQTALALVPKLAPALLGTGYGIYLAVGLAFIFVLVVLI